MASPTHTRHPPPESSSRMEARDPFQSKRPVRCSENEGIVAYLLAKRQEIADRNGIYENLDLTLVNAYRNIANCKTPITTIKELSQIKGVGKWILRLMKGYFPSEAAEVPQNGKETQKGKKTKAPKRYAPQKNSVAYALLITLYREFLKGSTFMKRQELIDAAEASGLSRTSIAPEKGVGKPGQFGSSPRDWYTGWSCMKGLVSKGLVVKSSSPAKYMLTEEGQETARECLRRSGLTDSAELVTRTEKSQSPACMQDGSELLFSDPSTIRNSELPSASSSHQLELIDSPVVPSQRNIQDDQFDISDSDSAELLEKDIGVVSCTSGFPVKLKDGNASSNEDSLFSASAPLNSSTLRPCTSSDPVIRMPSSNTDALEGDTYCLAVPPCSSEEKFEEIYDIILILDDRENFGSRSRKVVEILNTQFKIQVEVRRLPVGDGIWIARHKHLQSEYVLDFIVERKRVDDLRLSIKDNRYRDQKLRLLRCGLQKLIYLVEGDPNACEAAESIKTACFTTEILEGFDVQRTSGLTETLKKYGHLTQTIFHFYRTQSFIHRNKSDKICPSYKEFIKRCQNLEKLSVSDVFALQLMQVPQVTEEAALAVLELYPTVLSLAKAYALLEGDVHAQEQMLKNKSNLINRGASRNIFRLIWDR